MKRIGFLLLFMISSLCCLKAQMYSDSISVNFFLLDECRICQNISGEINYVYDRFDKDTFSFACYFPSTTSTPAKIDQFFEAYRLNLPYFTDYEHLKTNLYGASIAPQVVVYDEKNQRLLYRGRIDNSYDKVGSRRRIVTAKDLRTALTAISNQEAILQKETQAIGCYLNK